MHGRTGRWRISIAVISTCAILPCFLLWSLRLTVNGSADSCKAAAVNAANNTGINRVGCELSPVKPIKASMLCDVRNGFVRKFLNGFRQAFFDERLSHELSRAFRAEFAECLQPSHFADTFKRSLCSCVKPPRLTCGKRVYAFLGKVVVCVTCNASCHKCHAQCRVYDACSELCRHQRGVFDNHAANFLWI